MNDRIRVPKVRVIYGEKQLGVMDTHEAVRKAKSVGLDLVEVSSNARPPVCKIVDYGKYKYDQAKLKKEQPKKTHRLKEVKFRPGIGANDYNMKVTRAESFLMDEDKVRIQLMFRGRQMAHKEVGFELMKEVKEDLSGVAHIDMEPKLTGRNITMMLSPLPKHLQKPKFKNHGDLPDEVDDDFDDDDDDDGDEVEGDGDSNEEIEEFERPNEDHQHLDVVDEIAMLEGDDGRPKLKRG
ncbi:MAG: translation initiation factor IF-3 [Verrucomicrobiales bacterium]|nr:translation initiation factor IF-3 [Verrucomicrobiales bacterium]